MSSLFSTGDWAAIAGLGARKLWNVHSDGSVTFRDDEAENKSEVTVGPEEVQRRLRPLVSRAEAEELGNALARAAQPNLVENAYERSRAYRGALKGNDLRQMIDTLCGIYRHPNPGYPEEQNQDLLEAAVFSELAQVLEIKPGVLKARAKKAAGGSVLPDRTHELAAWRELPELDGHEAMGAFAVERSLALGESAAGLIELHARPGIWLAYFQDGEELADDDAEEAPPSKLVVVHAEVWSRFSELQGQLEPEPTELPIEGASMAVVDLDAARDKSFLRAVEYASHEVVAGRGVQVRLYGDGHGIAHVAREVGQAVLVSIDLR